MTLYEALTALAETETLPMHMPGHKRQAAFGGRLPYALDITEIPGFDDLHCRTGLLRDLAARLAKLRQAETAIPLVGGSTVGILAAVTAMTGPGETILLPRGCHKSVYHAAELARCDTCYLYPETDPALGFALSIDPAAVEAALTARPEIRLVVLTSPTYEGVVSDVAAIAAVAHRHGARLLVDAAHGAHFGFDPRFPQSAMACGADAAVESLHKTLPAMTQTAVLCLGRGVDPAPFERALGRLETSSPSYILLASIDRCASLLEAAGPELFDRYAAALAAFDVRVRGLRHLAVPGHTAPLPGFALDPGKLTISTAGTSVTASTLAAQLRAAYRIEPEMVSRDYLLCMTSVCDTEATLLRLAAALLDIDAGLTPATAPAAALPALRAEQTMPLWEAASCAGETLPLAQAAGRVSLRYLWAYPPGIPLVAPGERITAALLAQIRALQAAGVSVLQEGETDAEKISVLPMKSAAHS